MTKGNRITDKSPIRDREATEARLVQAVETTILQDGFGALGINALARRAGVDKVLIYRYFGGLPGLLAAYAERGDFWWQVEDILRDPGPGTGEPDALARTLRLVTERHAAFLRAHPVTLETLAWELAQRNELTEALETVREARSQAMMRRIAADLGLDEGALLARIWPDARAARRRRQLPRRAGATPPGLQRHRPLLGRRLEDPDRAAGLMLEGALDKTAAGRTPD